MRAETLRRFSTVDPAQLDQERDWRGAPSDLRFRLSWLSEGSEGRRVRMLSLGGQLGLPPRGDAQRAMMIAGETRGRLLGTLAGLPDATFNLQPAEGEWSIRQVLGHVIATDERYRIAVEYAVERARAGGTGPLRPPESSLPPRTGEAQATGSPAELLQRLQSARDAVILSLSTVPDDLLNAPTNWVSWDLDVRFRLHRFAAHDREHTIQLRKALQALGVMPTEPQLLLANAQAALGALEATLRNVGDAHLDREPPGGGPTIARLVDEMLEDERGI